MVWQSIIEQNITSYRKNYFQALKNTEKRGGPFCMEERGAPKLAETEGDFSMNIYWNISN